MRYAIGDLHGCLNTFKAVLSRINFSCKDELYLVGDLVDRGDKNALLIDYLIQLRQQEYEIYSIRGNHEENLLQINHEQPEIIRWYLNKMKSSDLLGADGLIEKKYIDFFQSLPYWIELEDFIIVHAGLNVSNDDIFSDKSAILEQRHTKATFEQLGGKYLIHGHQPTYRTEIRNRVGDKQVVLPIDNGVPYTKKHKIYDYTQLGHLCYFNLDTFEVEFQKNIE